MVLRCILHVQGSCVAGLKARFSFAQSISVQNKEFCCANYVQHWFLCAFALLPDLHNYFEMHRSTGHKSKLAGCRSCVWSKNRLVPIYGWFLVLFWPNSISDLHTHCTAIISQNVISVEILWNGYGCRAKTLTSTASLLFVMHEIYCFIADADILESRVVDL